jgi:starch synthase
MVDRVLFVSSEIYPLLKTGGLADVSYSLPVALRELGADVRLLMPAYRDALRRAGETRLAATLRIGAETVEILEARLGNMEIPLWLLAHPCFDRPGNPYLAPNGKPWPDSAERFALLCRAAVEIAQNRAGLNWRAEIVHGNDWQSGPTPALLSLETERPATVFTIHNLAYQGVFPAETFARLGLPDALWNHDGLEFHGQLSFLKGGIAFADRITTVSPTYAREIQTAEFGCGLEGLLSHRGARLSGILNGIDTDVWNPATDPLIAAPFDVRHLENKAASKHAAQRSLGLPEQDVAPLVVLISRLAQQKGIDLVLKAMPELMRMPLQLAFLGTGDAMYEQSLIYWTRRFPERVAAVVGFDEALSHLLEAGADMFLMPSRFEPCGLNQMYSQRYGTVPIVRQVGGLADTVSDAPPQGAELPVEASGFSFREATPEALTAAVRHALALFENHDAWRVIQGIGMSKDFSWTRSARQYFEIYRQAAEDCKGTGELGAINE